MGLLVAVPCRHVEQSVALPGGPADGCPTLVVEPSGQRVGAEVALDDEVGGAARGQAVQPAFEQVVEGGLADTDGWVRPAGVEAGVVGHVVRCGDEDVVEAGRGGVGLAQFPCPRVDVDGPDSGVGVAHRECQGDGSVAAPEVQQFGRPDVGRRSLLEEVPGAAVDPVGGEHAPVGGQVQVEVGQEKVELAGS